MATLNDGGAGAIIKRLEGLAPVFARAEPDILATTSRARALDYRGVLQNARLVCETLMRDIYTRELGTHPGKKMLGDLVSQFRQSANSKIIPPDVLIFVDGIAAAGNLGSHDHAGKLDEQGIRITAAHAVPVLNNLLALLEWYKDKYLAAPIDGGVSVATGDSLISRRSFAWAIGVVAAASTLWLATAKNESAGKLELHDQSAEPRQSAALEDSLERPATGAVPSTRSASKIVEDWYDKREEPRPPEPCSVKSEGLIRLASALGSDTATGMKALIADGRALSPEEQFVQALLTVESGGTAKGLAESAALCPGFAAAQNLAGRIALKEGRADTARAFFEAAMLMRPDYLKARFNLTLAMMAQGHLVEANRRLEELVLLMPARGEVLSALATARTALGKPQAAYEAWCKAAKLGVAEAVRRCADE